jgi:hypothetical protein
LKLPMMNKCTYNKYIDSLPRGPAWSCTPLEITGNVEDGDGELRKETIELWHRNAVEVVRELLGNPAFRRKLGYRPQRIWRNSRRTNREYGEMWTCNWWWLAQVS